jgi:L-erythro-3,5-diaminohexanoate dehydrogenase
MTRSGAGPGPGTAGPSAVSPAAAGSPLGLHRVLEPAGVLPQAAWRLDPSPQTWPDEVRVTLRRLNLDAASFRQLREASGGDPAAMKTAVLDIVASRGKMHNPVTGSGGMLTGVVAEVGPGSPLGLRPGQTIATLVSLSLTPLAITDGLAAWDGRSEQIPCAGHAILFGRSIAAVLPDDLPVPLALAVLDVCGAPALTRRVVAQAARQLAADAQPGRPGDRAAPRRDAGPAAPRRGDGPVVAILGAAGKSGSLSAAAARRAGAGHLIGVVPDQAEAAVLRSARSADGQAGLVDEVVIADARDPVALSGAVRGAGGPADVTVVCVDVPGCEGGAILATTDGGTVIFFSMATSFTAAALGAEGAAADVTMLVGNGFVPGHAALALDLIRAEPGVRAIFDRRVSGDVAEGSQPGKDADGYR